MTYMIGLQNISGFLVGPELEAEGKEQKLGNWQSLTRSWTFSTDCCRNRSLASCVGCCTGCRSENCIILSDLSPWHTFILESSVRPGISLFLHFPCFFVVVVCLFCLFCLIVCHQFKCNSPSLASPIPSLINETVSSHQWQLKPHCQSLHFLG